jgi:hypothetical protein
MSDTLFTFAHLPDSHMYDVTDSPAYSGESIYGSTLDVVTPLIESLNAEREHALPDFVVFGGDNIDGCIPGPYDQGLICDRQMSRFKRLVDDLKAPAYVIGHTHDVWGEDDESMRVILGKVADLPPDHTSPGPGGGAALRECFGEEAFRRVVTLPGDFTAIFMSECQMEDGEFITVEKKLDWLAGELEKASDQWVLFFSHVPILWARHPEANVKFPAQSASYNFSGSHAPLAELFARHGRVLAQYSGHLHVHGHDQSGTTHVVTTCSPCNYPGEYRLVTVKRDRIEHRCVGIPALADQPICWIGRTDESHSSDARFHHGLPHERDFVISYGP